MARHSSRNLPLKLSVVPLCQGLPGSINTDSIRRSTTHLSSATLTKTGERRLIEVRIGTIHRYLPVLSANGTRWILPSYLQYCLSDEAREHSRIETWSLIDTLSPEAQFVGDTLH